MIRENSPAPSDLSHALTRQAVIGLLLVLPAIFLVVSIVVVPTLYALLASLKNNGEWTLANYLTLFTTPPYPNVIANTMWISLIVTAATMLLSIPLAMFLSVQPARSATLVLVLISASLWISVLVKIYAWQVLLARNGPLNALLVEAGLVSAPVPFLYSRAPVVLSMIQFLVPYATMMMYASMRRVDWDLITAARSLGGQIWFVAAEVYWPQIRFSVVTAALVVFMLATSFYVAPALLGGPGDTMIGMQMHSDLVNRHDSGMAATAGVALSAILLGVSWVALKMAGVSFTRAAGALSR
ncbi:MAG: ABC transporter permease [Rhizobiaceae bacterium]|nr:ABC transporter permease [Rhizobiaceae bacterium]